VRKIGRIRAPNNTRSRQLQRYTKFENDNEATMRMLSVWVVEFIKLLEGDVGRRRKANTTDCFDRFALTQILARQKP
jgi:hypothetical protein